MKLFFENLKEVLKKTSAKSGRQRMKKGCY